MMAGKGKKAKQAVGRAASAVGGYAKRAARERVVYVQTRSRELISWKGVKRLLGRAVQVGLGGGVGGVVTVIGDVADVSATTYGLMAAGATGLSMVLGAESMADAFGGSMVAHATVKKGAKAIQDLVK